MDLLKLKKLKGNISDITVSEYSICKTQKPFTLVSTTEIELDTQNRPLEIIKLEVNNQISNKQFFKYNRVSNRLEQQDIIITTSCQIREFMVTFDEYFNQYLEELDLSTNASIRIGGNYISLGELDSTESVTMSVRIDEHGELYINANLYDGDLKLIESRKYSGPNDLVHQKKYFFDKEDRIQLIETMHRKGKILTKTQFEYNPMYTVRREYFKEQLQCVEYSIAANNFKNCLQSVKPSAGLVDTFIKTYNVDDFSNPSYIVRYEFDYQVNEFIPKSVQKVNYKYQKENYITKYQSREKPPEKIDKYGYVSTDYEYTDHRKAYRADNNYNLDGTRANTYKRTCKSCKAFRGNNKCTRYPNTELHEDWGCCDSFSPIIEYRMSHFWHNEKLLRNLGLYDIATERYKNRYEIELSRRREEALAFKELTEKTGKTVLQILQEMIGLE